MLKIVESKCPRLRRLVILGPNKLHMDACAVAKRLLIEKETVVTNMHNLTPELKFHLITEDCRLWTSKDTGPFRDPFWAFYWPGGQGIARYVLDNPNIVRARNILDFGSGCGACGLAAKLAQANTVTFNDIDPNSAIALQMNGKLNGISVDKICTENRIGMPIQEDILLMGDMLYDEEFAKELIPWIRMLIKQGKKLIVGDPGRVFIESIQENFSLKNLATYKLDGRTSNQNNGFSTTSVYSISHSKLYSYDFYIHPDMKESNEF